MLVAERIMIENKSVQPMPPNHEAQDLMYLKLSEPRSRRRSWRSGRLRGESLLFTPIGTDDCGLNQSVGFRLSRASKSRTVASNPVIRRPQGVNGYGPQDSRIQEARGLESGIGDSQDAHRTETTVGGPIYGRAPSTTSGGTAAMFLVTGAPLAGHCAGTDKRTVRN
jgi:hypothetical protein